MQNRNFSIISTLRQVRASAQGEGPAVPETKYGSRIYLVVRTEADQAGQAATRVYQEFVGRLRRVAPTVRELRLELEEPAPRKEDAGVFECWATLKAVVPHDLSRPGAANHRDAWRAIVREEFQTACMLNHAVVHHTSSRVEITREIFPHEEVPQAPKAPVEEKPKEMIQVRVLLGGQEYNVEIPKGENLLDGVNDKGVAVKWDCKNGVCDTCQIRVLKGAENLSPVNDAEREMLGDKVNQGYRLCCQVTAYGPCEIQQ